ncbi:MAG: hypothetical protein PHD81_00835 [Candidatus Nanoarchaeia archaeon]|nr:hypothetical protein [Candidatus Nanoarchaeia archaeon]MDD5587635.1 hypothetical protein [Candidatus Nanoarchaeia archaeon]
MNKKNVVNSVLISFLVLLSLYFVIAGISSSYGTVMNINPGTSNYSSTDSYIWFKNGTSAWLNFTVNNSASVAFVGNISNISISLPGVTHFTLDGTLNGSNCTQAGAWNFTMSAIKNNAYFIANASFKDGIANTSRQCFFWINLTANSSVASAETVVVLTLNVSNATDATTRQSLTWNLGVDMRAPRITECNATIDTASGNTAAVIISHGSTALAVQNAYFRNDSNISIRCLVTDATINKTNITLWYNYTGTPTIGRGSNGSNMTVSACSVTSGIETCSFNATIVNPGLSVGRNVSFMIVASDKMGYGSNDTNSEKGYNFTFRNTASVPSISVPDEKLIVFRPYDFGCDGDTNLTVLTDSSKSITICTGTNACAAEYTPTTAGTHTLQCETTDAAGNKQIVTRDVIVYSRSSTTGSSSSGTSGGTVVPTPTSIDISKEATTEGLRAGDTQPFTYDAASHTMKVDSVSSGTVTVTIDDKVTTTLEPAKPVEIDITGDGSKDVKLTLNKIVLNKADITLEMLVGATKATTTEEQTTQKAGSLTWLWVVLGIVVIAGVIWAIVAMKKK